MVILKTILNSFQILEISFQKNHYVCNKKKSIFLQMCEILQRKKKTILVPLLEILKSKKY